MQRFSVTPTDLLFFRDGRPMETGEGSGGHGSRWPFPTVLFDAIHAALHRAFPENSAPQDWDVRHQARGHNGRQGDLRFGGLRTVGPFPQEKSGDWLFPAPLDARPGADKAAHALRILRPGAGRCNLPMPLSALAASNQSQSKDPVPAWWTKGDMEAFLLHGTAQVRELPEPLWTTEWTTGIGIDPLRGTQDGARIYSASYLRLHSDVSLGCAGMLPGTGGVADALDVLFPADARIVCGGQQRVCNVRRINMPLAEVLPRSAPVPGEKVKWSLLSPAIFPKSSGHPGGWLPSWVDPQTGRVLLPREKPARQPGESRHRWRQRSLQNVTPLDVTLIAACVGKPEVVTGWSDHLVTADGARGSAKPTRLAVPAGSVYYFEGPDARLLAKLLSWHGSGDDIPQCRSGALGEKGLGLGVTAPWTEF